MLWFKNILKSFIPLILCLLSVKLAGQATIISNQNQNRFARYFDTSANTLYINYGDEVRSYDSRGLFYFVKYLPGDMWQLAKSPFRKANLEGLGLVVISTAVLLPFDQYFLDKVRQASQRINLADNTSYGVAVGKGEIILVKYPKNVNSALYQLGEGGTSMYLAGGLWIYGKLAKDYRAVQTAGDLVETFIVMGVTTQILKRISGRESPYVSTQHGGAWRPLPALKEYQSHVPRYDAFPSGHLATMMATITVLHSNYPEKKWILPVGYTIMGMTAWAMVNTEVHWISDYPLALALGYVSGKVSTMRHAKVQSDEIKKRFINPEMTP